MYYKLSDHPEFHVWDMGSYDQLDCKAIFKSSWMSKYISKDDAVLDIGCGPGYTVKVLLENDIKVLGVDLNDASVAKAQKAGLPVIKEDALEIIEKRGKEFNFFNMSDFVEHVPLEVVLNILINISKQPLARIFICTPNLDSLMGFKFWFHMPTHINAMHPFVIRQLLERTGYTIEKEWSEYGNLPGKGWKLKLRKFILNKLFGTQASLFMGGANICYIAKVKS